MAIQPAGSSEAADTAIPPLKYLSISKAKQGSEYLSETLHGQHADSDLVSGVYEGGLKVWDCSFDLVDYVFQNGAARFAGKRVIELGCGQGLPGIMALKVGAAKVVFQDFNAEVLNKATKPVIEMNLDGTAGLSDGDSSYTLLPGAWQDLT